MYHLISLFQSYVEKDFDIVNGKKGKGSSERLHSVPRFIVKKCLSWDLNSDLATLSPKCLSTMWLPLVLSKSLRTSIHGV